MHKASAGSSVAAAEPEYEHPDEIEERFRVSRHTLQAWRNRRIGPPWIKRGRMILYNVREFRRFIEDGRQQPLAASKPAA